MRAASESQRRFTLFDAITLVAGAGLCAFMLTRKPEAYYFTRFTGEGYSIRERVLLFQDTINGSIACVRIMSFALVLLSLVRPRPPLRQLGRQPGLLACYMATFTFLIHAGLMTFGQHVGSTFGNHLATSTFSSSLLSSISNQSATGSGFAILGGWATLKLTGQWEPTSCWLDRPGCVLGVMIIVSLLFHLLIPYLY